MSSNGRDIAGGSNADIMQGYVAPKRDRCYAVSYQRIDPRTGLSMRWLARRRCESGRTPCRSPAVAGPIRETPCGSVAFATHSSRKALEEPLEVRPMNDEALARRSG